MDFKEMMEKEKEERQKQNGKKDKNGFRPNLNWLFLLIFVVLIAMNYMEDGEKQRQIPYSQFEQLVSKDVLLNVTINTDANTAKAEIKPDSVAKVLGKNAVEKGQKAFVQVNVPSVDQASKMLSERQFKGEVKYAKDDGIFSKFLFAFGPIILFVALWIFMLRRMSGGIGGGGVFSVGKSKAQVFDKDNKVNVTFKDVAGLAGAKRGNRGVPEEPKEIYRPRRKDTYRSVARRPSRNRKDFAGKGCRRRGGSSVLLYVGFRLCGDVRRRRSEPCERFVQAG